jgi:uncharacterized protein (TIGR02594 family)
MFGQLLRRLLHDDRRPARRALSKNGEKNRPFALAVPVQIAPTVPAWYTIATGELGQAEIPGPADNPRIREYHAAGGLPYAGDETAWCASFVNWCLREAGLAGTERPNARSFLAYGQEAIEPRLGDIVVLWRSDPNHWTGHVGFFVAADGLELRLLGGNQGNCVSVQEYPWSRVLGIRRP